MTLKTRQPTGKPPWPIILLAGGEKCGKSYAAAALSASDLVDRTFWIEIGEGSADQYGALPGARYEIVEHDGSYPSMLAAAQEAAKVPTRGKPHAIVVDSMTELWDLLSEEQAAIAAKRNKTTITMDQWNTAKKRWRRFVDALRANTGPVVLTARFEQVTVVEGGKPAEIIRPDGSKEPKREWKVRAEKNLGFEVDGIIEIPRPRSYFLNGVRSLKFDVPPGGHLALPGDFTLDGFLRDLGIAGNAGERTYVAPRFDPNADEENQPGRVTAAEILGSSRGAAPTPAEPPADVPQPPSEHPALGEDGWPAVPKPGEGQPRTRS